MKKIIIGGCSFTDKNMPKTAQPESMNFKMWPEVLGDLTGYEIINTAICGIGNRRILNDVINEIVKHEPKDIAYVIVAWTEWTRQDFLIEATVPSKRTWRTYGYEWDLKLKEKAKKNNVSFNSFKLKEDAEKNWRTIIPKFADEKDNYTKEIPHEDKYLDRMYSTAFDAGYPNDKAISDTNLQKIFALQSICESQHIDYRMFQVLPPFNLWKQQHIRNFINNPISSIINESKFIGYPIFESLGGYDISDLLISKFGRMGMRINLVDGHPNEKSHEFIAERVFKTLDL